MRLILDAIKYEQQRVCYTSGDQIFVGVSDLKLVWTFIQSFPRPIFS